MNDDSRARELTQELTQELEELLAKLMQDYPDQPITIRLQVSGAWTLYTEESE